MIRMTETDRPTLETFLREHLTDAMFPLSNLARHGMAGGHRHAMSFWADDPAQPSAVLGVTDEGMVMPVGNGAVESDAVVAILRGRPIIGFAAASGPARNVMEACDLLGAPSILDKDEPQYGLELSALRLPDGGGALAPLSVALETAVKWRVAYDVELHLGTEADARTRAEPGVEAYIQADSHRFLMDGETPMAMTGFNASLPDIVQVGGVYVPPVRRGSGLAGRAVALHLREAKARGVTRATLFAASPAAGRVYERIGFERIGTFALVLFNGSQVVQ